MRRRIEHVLEHLEEVGLVHRRLGREDALPNIALLEQVDAKLVKVDLGTLMPNSVSSLSLNTLPRLRDVKRPCRVIVVDEASDLVAETLHLEEALATEHSTEQVVLLLGQCRFGLRWHQTTLVGKKRMSLGVLLLKNSPTRADRRAGSMLRSVLNSPASPSF